MWPRKSAIAAVAPMVAALAMALAAPALGADAPAKPTETGAQPGKDSLPKEPKEKLICTSEVVTGSVMNKRVCKTQKQIDDDRRSAKEMRQQLGSGAGGISGDRPSSVR